MGFYAQDDWRVTPRLTLNLGMRYEPATQWVEVNGITANLRNIATDPTTTIGPLFRNSTLRNWSLARFGFALGRCWKRAVRQFEVASLWARYDLATLGVAANSVVMYDPPFDPVATVTGNLTFTIPFTLPANAGVTQVYRGPAYNYWQPHMMTYNLTLERQLPGSMALTVAYAGSRGINLQQDEEGNPEIPNGIPSGGICVKPTAGTAINLTSQIQGQATSCYIGAARRNPNWSSLITQVAGGDSIYNALEVMLNRRLSKGLQLQSSYTWSKLIDDAASGFVGDDGQGATTVTGNDPIHELPNRGPSNFDLTNNWRVNAIYRLPDFTSSTGILGKVANGWWTSGIFSLLSGYPISAFLGANRSTDGANSGVPSFLELASVVPGRTNSNITHGVSSGCGTGAVRAAGGTAIAAGTPVGNPKFVVGPLRIFGSGTRILGNEGRNYLRGPGYDNLNFSLVKDTAVRFLGEGGQVEFRAEFFNLFNHPNFALPNKASSTGFAGTCPGVAPVSLGACGGSVVSPTAAAGTITATQGAARQIQFGLKILF